MVILTVFSALNNYTKKKKKKKKNLTLHDIGNILLVNLSYVPTSNVSVAKLVCYRQICWYKLKYMVKFHWQIYRAMLSELSKMCSCKWRTLIKWFDKLPRCRRGKCDKLFWQRWRIQLTPSACYTRSSKQTLCVGLEGQRVFEQRRKTRVEPMTNFCK